MLCRNGIIERKQYSPQAENKQKNAEQSQSDNAPDDEFLVSGVKGFGFAGCLLAPDHVARRVFPHF